jgi:hypothetical protein
LAVSGCGLDTGAVAPSGDGGGDAAFDTGGVDARVPDAATRDSRVGDAVADAPDPDPDAGPPRPTAIVTTPAAGGQGSQPAVLWNGGEFVIGLITEGHVTLLRMPPGRALSVPERVSTGPGVGRQDVMLATDDGGRLAVGWTEDRAGDQSLMVRILPTDSAPRFVRGGLFREADRQDAALYGTGSTFGALVRDEATTGVQRLQYVDVAVGSPTHLSTGAGSFGELDIRPSPHGPLFVTGRPQVIYRREGNLWVVAAGPILGEGSEGSVAPLLDGSIASVWLHAPLFGGPRLLSHVRHRPGLVWIEERSGPLGIEGSDPALAPFEGGSLMAFSYPDGAERTLGLAALDPDGNVVAGPCRVPAVAPVTNDPDLACAAGWCAIAWMEASAYDAMDYVTRVIQVPTDRDFLCP